MYYLVYKLDGIRITEHYSTEELLKLRVDTIFNKVTGLHYGFEPKEYERENRWYMKLNKAKLETIMHENISINVYKKTIQLIESKINQGAERTIALYKDCYYEAKRSVA